VTLKDFQSSQERRTVAQANATERERSRLRPRHLFLTFALGIIAGLLLSGCAAHPSPELTQGWLPCTDAEVVK